MIASVVKIDVKDIFRRSFIKQTKALSGIKLFDSAPFQWNQNNIMSCAATSGKIYYSTIVCSMDHGLRDVLLHGMDEEWEKSDIEAYLEEYINIVCGRAISEINNTLKAPSRFSIPSIREGEYAIKKIGEMEFKKMEYEEIYFANNSGRMKIELFYEMRKME